MNPKSIFSVLSYTTFLILLICCRSSQTTVYTKTQKRVIVVKEKPQVIVYKEKPQVIIVKEPNLVKQPPKTINEKPGNDEVAIKEKERKDREEKERRATTGRRRGDYSN